MTAYVSRIRNVGQNNVTVKIRTYTFQKLRSARLDRTMQLRQVKTAHRLSRIYNPLFSSSL